MVSLSSFLVIAQAAGTVIVIAPEISKIELKYGISERKSKNRISMNTPAVTNVEEWTSAETGVGAAMAQVSQAVNGNWALLVKAAMVSNSVIILDERMDSFHILPIIQCPCEEASAIVRRIKQSPIRFLTRVMAPLFSDREF